MGDRIKLKIDTKIDLDSNVLNFLSPKYIFIPIRDGFKLKVIDNDYVYKNDIVMFDKFGHTLHSSVSGKVLGVKNMLYFDDKKISSLVIENDFKENIRIRKSYKKFIETYNKSDFLNIIRDNSYNYKGDYIEDKISNKYNTLIINGVELEPYFGNKYFIIKNNVENILDTIDLIIELFDLSSAKLIIKNTDYKIVDEFIDKIGTYPNIELTLVDDIYPMGLGKYILKQIKCNSPILLDVVEIMEIFKILKKQMPITEKLITISGNAVKPRKVINVKVGTVLSEVFINNFDFITEKVDVYLNGIMTGKKINTLNYVIDSNIDGIIINKEENKIINKCINCGLCRNNCPVGLNPKLVFEKCGDVSQEYKNKCIRCGLCNYVCPSNIDLKKYMAGDDF